MQKYRVMIHGKNLLSEVSGVRQKLSFFTNVFVEAIDAGDAESRAIRFMREDEDLAKIVLNGNDDPLDLSVEEVQQLESFEGCRTPRDSFMLYPPT